MKRCGDCGAEIGERTAHVVQDGTGKRFCLACCDKHWDVTTVLPSCSCSRGGNALYCECREFSALTQDQFDALADLGPEVAAGTLTPEEARAIACSASLTEVSRAQ